MSFAAPNVPLVAALVHACLLLALPGAAGEGANRVTVAVYNVESGGAEAETVARVVERTRDVDLWGFSELAGRSWLQRFQRAAERDGGHYGSRLGTTGVYRDRPSDRLGLLWNTRTLELIEQRELGGVDDGAHRAPLVARLRHRASGQSLTVALVHLAAADAPLRMRQSRALQSWAIAQAEPVVLMGDFNYRWTLTAEPGGGPVPPAPPGFAALTRGGALSWIRPRPLRHTFCGGAADAILDYVFVNAPARAWPARATVVATACAKESPAVSDHRPVRVAVELP